jgi:malate/lactate dehydrogenase
MKISIIGAAGYVGSTVALNLALHGLAEEFVLIDPYKPNVVTQLAMDTGTAAAEQRVHVRAGEFSDMKSSHIVIVTAGAAQGVLSSRMEMLPKNLPIIRDIAKKIKEYAPDAIVITTTNPVDPLNYMMHRCTEFDRFKIIGYSSNDSIRFRQMIADAFGYEFADVRAVVIGEHGESQVPLFSSVEVKGKPMKVDEHTKQKIRSQISEVLRRYEELKTGRTAGVTTATGIKEIIEAIVNNTHETIPSSVVLDGEYGQRNLSMGVPLVLGSGGIIEIKELTAAPDEQTFLNATISVLKSAMEQVDGCPGVPPLG